MPSVSAMMNAAAPMIGGVICPPHDALASTAPAKRGEKPTRFISGIVITPVVTVLAMALPLIMPEQARRHHAHLGRPAGEAARPRWWRG
jgi:hypothetical protein